jgi:hypothetical protein
MKWADIWRIGGQAMRESPLVAREMEAAAELLNAPDLPEATHRPLQEGMAIMQIIRDEAPVFLDEERQGRDWIDFLNGRQWLPVCRPSRTVEQREANLLQHLAGMQEKLAQAAGSALQSLAECWKKETPDQRWDVPLTEEDRRKPELICPRTKAAEEFVCRVFLNTIVGVILHTRNLVFTIAGMFFLVLMSLISYPFQPANTLRGAMILLAIAIGLVVVYVLGAMHRNTTLSHITETTPDSLGVEFWVRIAMASALPLLGLIAAQFPSLASMTSWLQPALEAAK